MHKFVINSQERIKEENELLDSIKNIKIVSGILQQTNNNNKEKNEISLKEKLNEFKYDVAYVSKEENIYSIIDKYLSKSNEIKNSPKIKLIDLFSVKEKNSINITNNKNKKLLWYGIRIQNFANVFKSGLSLPPPEAPIYSYMFGKGIYFSDVAIKSFYNSHPQNNIGLMMLCEVALGDIEERNRGDYNLPYTMKNEKNSIKVIGIHKQGDTAHTENYADFIYPIFDIIKNGFELIKKPIPQPPVIIHSIIKIYYENGKLMYEGGFIDNKFEGYGKYYYLNDEYYEGQFKNGLRNGKGILYYSNGNIIYEGDFVNDKFEGNGKYIYGGGEYYNGQWKDNKKNGKGSLYAKNGNIIYVGDFVNDNYEGNGRFYFEGGGYYDGQWKNHKKNGKGKIYDKYGKIKYDGDFINDQKDGYGIYYYDGGEYYKGYWKNNMKNGKGIIYYKNGNIIFDGNFINDQKNGDGKYIWEDGKFYIGPWYNNYRNGKGKMYYNNGSIMYDGDYKNDKKEGYGKYIYDDGIYYIGQWYNDLRNGKGKMYYKNGSIMYDGDFIDDKREGYGKYYFENGETLIGNWKNDKPIGTVNIYYKNGNLKFQGDCRGKIEFNF